MDYRRSATRVGSGASYSELLESQPRRAVEKAVKGMLPHNKARSPADQEGSRSAAGPEHPHAAQMPQPFQITQVAQ